MNKILNDFGYMGVCLLTGILILLAIPVMPFIQAYQERKDKEPQCLKQ
jgi:hypothetical protein